MTRVRQCDGIVILAPLASEAGVLRRAPRGARVVTIGLRASGIRRAMGLIGADDRLVILAGFGGGLSRELRCGDVVVDGPPEGFQAREGCVVGAIHTAGEIVSTPFDKERLRARTGAVAVDMELSIVREALRERGVRVVGVRAILDPASRTLPTWLSGVVAPTGETRLGALAIAVLRDPRRIGQLLWLAGASRQAGRGLARVVSALVEDWAGEGVMP